MSDVLSSLQDKVMAYIKKHDMIRPGHKVVVAVSGGPDSMVLLHILMALKDILEIELIVAHVEHGIRGARSVEDAEYVMSAAQKLGLPIYIKRCNVPAYAKEYGLSEEQAGRIIRYDFFNEICRYRHCDSIAVAHNKNDNVETLLLHILRGSGLDGLTGIKPVLGKIIRPLLEVSRAEIEAYCSAAHINPRRDYTNDDLSYTRNRIRLKLIPLLADDFNPNITEALTRTAAILSDDDDFLNRCTMDVFDRCVHKDDGIIVLDISAFNATHIALRRRLLRFIILRLKGDLNGIEYMHIEQLLAYIEESRVGTKLMLPSDIMAERGYDKIYIYLGNSARKMSEPFCAAISVPGDTYVKNGEAVLSSSIIDKNYINDYNAYVSTAYMDMDKIHFPIYIRNRRPGDRFKPIGSSGHKKLKEYFIDQKVPRLYRDQIPLIASGSEVLWIIGDRLSDICKVDDSTQRVLKLTYNIIDKK